MHPRFITALVAIVVLVAPLASASPKHSEPRTIIELQENWRFLKGDPANAASPETEDNKWEIISLPHTWNNLDGQDGGNNYYRGPAWYRKTLDIPESLTGKRVYLECDAANRFAEVFLEGKRIGEHVGGFSRFRFDLTPFIRPGSHPLLAFKVDNAHRDDSPPLTADFTFCGGLYRGVRLVLVSEVHVALLDEGSPGVEFVQSEISASSARVSAQVKLKSDRASPGVIDLVANVRDATGATVATSRRTLTLEPGAASSTALPFTVEQPHVWQGLQDPYLYTCRIEVRENERVIDAVEQPLGLRTVALDPNRGFLLNGKPYPLHGVNRHQDRIDKGWAVSLADHEEDFRIIQEMGANTVRLAHYQQAEEVYDLCDRLGLIVWAENSMVNQITDSPAFYANSAHQLIELIRQNFNHPSIVVWSVQNEITNVRGPDATPLTRELARIVAQEDPSRPSVAASDSDEHGSNWETAALGQNRYYGWYSGSLDKFQPWLDAYHTAHAKVPLCISEYGAGASIAQHEWPVRQPKPNSPWHPEEWQALFHEEYWSVLRDRPWVWGSFVWAMFDFASDGRNEGDHSGRNDKGLVTYDRKTRKDAFYFYQANWSSLPMVHIASGRFTQRTVAETEIKVYANTPQVALWINGRSLGTRTPDSIHRCVWPKVILLPGDNEVKVVATTADGGTVTDSCHWILSP